MKSPQHNRKLPFTFLEMFSPSFPHQWTIEEIYELYHISPGALNSLLPIQEIVDIVLITAPVIHISP